MFNKGASFVTLTENGQLRGCIGSVFGRQSVAKDVADNTYAAALEDKRFNPLTAQDLPNLKISISLLTGYERILRGEEPFVNAADGSAQGITLAGTKYPLQEAELIQCRIARAAANGGAKKYYSLTPKGRAVLEELMGFWAGYEACVNGFIESYQQARVSK